MSERPSSKIKERMGRKKYRNFKKIAVPKFFGIFDPLFDVAQGLL
jgi:hypothetical protein